MDFLSKLWTENWLLIGHWEVGWCLQYIDFSSWLTQIVNKKWWRGNWTKSRNAPSILLNISNKEYWKFSRKCRNGLFCFDQWPIETSFAPQFCYKLYPSLTVNQWNVQHVRIGTTLFQIIAKNLYWFDRILVLQTDFSEYFLTKLTGEPIHWILLVFVMGSLTESLFMYLFANATLIVIYELKLFHLWLASKPKQNIFNIKWGKFI